MATDAGVARAREWLRRNQLGHLEPSALLVERLEARRRGKWIYALTFLVCLLVLLAVSTVAGRSGSALDPDRSDVVRLASVVLNNVGYIVAMGVGLWSAHRAERRLMLASRIRTAHPA